MNKQEIEKLLSLPDTLLKEQMSNMVECELFTLAWYDTQRIFKLIKDPEISLILRLLPKDPFIIKYIENQPARLQVDAVTLNPYTIKYIKHPCRKAQEIAVTKDGSLLLYIKEPYDEEIAKIAISDYPMSILYIKDPSPELQYIAFSKQPKLLYSLHLSDFDRDVIERVDDEQVLGLLLYRKDDEYAIKYFSKYPHLIDNKRSIAVQIAAVSVQGSSIKNIDNPCNAVQMAAVKQYPKAIRFIKNPHHEVMEYAIRLEPQVIKYIKNPSEELQLLAVNRFGTTFGHINGSKVDKVSNTIIMIENAPGGEILKYINNPTQIVKEMAITLCPDNIKHVEQTPELQKLAVSLDPFVIIHINNPTDEAEAIAWKE